MSSLLWLVFAVLLVLWLVGYAVNWGAFIWVLLLFALVALVVNLVTGTRRGRWYAGRAWMRAASSHFASGKGHSPVSCQIS